MSAETEGRARARRFGIAVDNGSERAGTRGRCRSAVEARATASGVGAAGLAAPLCGGAGPRGTRRRPRAAAAAVLALALATSACTIDGEQYRGTDHSAWLPVARASFGLGRSEAVGPATTSRTPASEAALRDGAAADRPAPDRVTWRPALAGAITHVDGDFAQGPGAVDYRAFAALVGFQPDVAWRDVHFEPFAGLGYSEVELDAGVDEASSGGIGPAVGAALGYRGLGPLEPFVRYERVFSGETPIGRFEAGLELRASRWLGLQVAYARQVSEAEDVDLFGLPGGDAVRVASDGVLVGLSLRF